MINTNKIKGRITELNLSQAKVAESLGIAPKTLSLKLKQGRLSNEEIEKLIKILNIKESEISDFFFPKILSSKGLRMDSGDSKKVKWETIKNERD